MIIHRQHANTQSARIHKQVHKVVEPAPGKGVRPCMLTLPESPSPVKSGYVQRRFKKWRLKNEDELLGSFFFILVGLFFVIGHLLKKKRRGPTKCLILFQLQRKNSSNCQFVQSTTKSQSLTLSLEVLHPAPTPALRPPIDDT